MSMEQQSLRPNIDKINTDSRLFGAISEQDEWTGSHEKQHAEHLAAEKPNVVEHFAKHNVDGLHGASSLSLEGVLEHGIVPARTLKGLSVVALGLEHHSQPHEREGVHLALWSRAGETIRYAELRVHPKTDEYVTPSNAEELAEESAEKYEELLPPSALRDHHTGRIREAREWQQRLQDNPELKGYPFYPLVYGISSAKLPEEVSISRTESDLKGDVQVGNSIPRDAIKTIFAPTEHHEHLTEVLAARRFEDIAVLPLEDLRTLDEAEYGYILPRKPRF